MDHSMGGPRPQDSFDPPPDNSNAPFKPHLAHWQDFLVQSYVCTLPQLLTRLPFARVMSVDKHPCGVLTASPAAEDLF